MGRVARLAVLMSLIVSLSLVPNLAAEQLTREQAEEQGLDLPGNEPAVSSGPPVPRSATLALPDFLLIPESTNDRVMSFDPTTGDLIDADFIPSDPTNLSTPIHAILSSGNDSILVSDQIDDVVQEYALNGTFIGLFAPAGGVDNTILDNIRGISLRASGNLLVTVGGGANDDAVAEFDTSGNSVGNFVANGAGGLDSPFDVLLTSETLVGGINSDAIHRYDLSGAYLADLAPVDSFPEQLAMAANGNLLVANFSGTQAGIMEIASNGTVVAIYTSSESGFRGVYELPNDNLLVTNGNGVHEIDKSGNLVATKISGVSARFIELIQGAIPVELQSFTIE